MRSARHRAKIVHEAVTGDRTLIREEQSIVISCPVDAVFAFVADQTNAPRWQQGLLEVQRITPGPPGLGSKHTLVRKFMGQRVEASNEYIEYVPNSRIAFKGTTGTGDFTAWYLTEPAGGGTRLTAIVEMGSGSIGNRADAQISASLRHDMQANFYDLQELLEKRSRNG
jgi:uncharacterized protein YndB with AHSA1/START domain